MQVTGTTVARITNVAIQPGDGGGRAVPLSARGRLPGRPDA